MKVINMEQVQSRAVEYVYKKHFAVGMLNLIVGRPGQGKSMLTASLTAEVTRQGHNVIFSNKEDAVEYTTKPRMEAAGADMSKVTVLEDLQLETDLTDLEALIVARDAKLLILDPIAAHLKVSIYNDQAVRTALTPLKDMAERTGCAVIVIHHTKKGMSKKANPMDAIGGASGGLPGAARMIYAFGKTDDMNDDARIIVNIKCNIAEQPKGIVYTVDSVDLDSGAEAGRLVIDQEDVEVDAIDVLTSSGTKQGETSESAPKKAMAAEWLTTMLSGGAQRVESLKTMAQVEGLAWRTIRRAAEDVEVVKTRQGFGPGSFIEWSLPAGHPAIKA